MCACKIMWIIQPVLIIIVLHMLEVTSENNCTARSSNKNDSTKTSHKEICTVLNPLVYGFICFLAAVVFILLIILFTVTLRHFFNSGMRVDTHEKREPTPVCQNDAIINIHTPPVNGADDSSSTSSESPDGSLSDISSGCQRNASAQERRKDSDYINISEGVSSGQVDFKKNAKTRQHIDYVNVNEPRKTTKKEKCDDDINASVSSETSVESAVNYSTVVFTKVN
ncbi:uncharacterized protein [Misgurnus anguillicaudatus]|uniref:uncharacterized protein n=1 Tax=Misgurnus anguillicaudatus TaxID=75329 RepID=UPI003CCFD858